MELTNAKRIKDFFIHFEGNMAKATFIGGNEADYKKAKELLIENMKGRGFNCLFGVKGIIYFKKEKAG